MSLKTQRLIKLSENLNKFDFSLNLSKHKNYPKKKKQKKHYSQVGPPITCYNQSSLLVLTGKVWWGGYAHVSQMLRGLSQCAELDIDKSQKPWAIFLSGF